MIRFRQAFLLLFAALVLMSVPGCGELKNTLEGVFEDALDELTGELADRLGERDLPVFAPGDSVEAGQTEDSIEVALSDLGIEEVPFAVGFVPSLDSAGDEAVSIDSDNAVTSSTEPAPTRTNIVRYDDQGKTLPAADFVAEDVFVGRAGITFVIRSRHFFQLCHRLPADFDRNPEGGGGLFIPDESVLDWPIVANDQCPGLSDRVFRVPVDESGNVPMELDTVLPADGQQSYLGDNTIGFWWQANVGVTAFFDYDSNPPKVLNYCDRGASQFCPPGAITHCVPDDESCQDGDIVTRSDPATIVGENVEGEILTPDGRIINFTGAEPEIKVLKTTLQDPRFESISGNFVYVFDQGPSAAPAFVMDTRSGARSFDFDWGPAVGEDHFLTTNEDDGTGNRSLVLVSFTDTGVADVTPVTQSTLADGSQVTSTTVGATEIFTGDDRELLLEDDGLVVFGRNLCGTSFGATGSPETIDVCRVKPDATIEWVAGPLPGSTNGGNQYGFAGTHAVVKQGNDALSYMTPGTSMVFSLVEESDGITITQLVLGRGRVLYVGENAFGDGVAMSVDLDSGESRELDTDLALKKIFALR